MKKTYKEILIEEEQERLRNDSESRKISKLLAGRRCPSTKGVIRLLNKKRGDKNE